MIYTAYLDESDTHGDSPTVIMAGVLGHENQWYRFNRILRALQKKHTFNIIHGTDLKRMKGEFRGWSVDQCLALIKDITEYCERLLSSGCVISMPHDLYRKEYRELPFPKGMKPDSQYGLCFRLCLAQLGRIVRTENSQAILNIVLESGHKNAGDVERIFNEFKTVLTEAGLNNFGSFSTANKHEAMPLMVADFFAHAHSIINSKGWDIARFSIPELQGSSHVMMNHINVDPSYLHELKQNFHERKDDKMKEWKNMRSNERD